MIQQQIHTDNTETLTGALQLIADIREAAGDPEGKLTQDELVARIRRMRITLRRIALWQTEETEAEALNALK